MALSHILAAITAEADHQIAEATTAHKASLKALAEHHASVLHVIAESVQRKKKDRIQQLRQRAEDHTSLLRRHAVLDRKQRIVDEFYDSVIRELSAMSPSQAEKLMTGWVAQLPEGGKILPSKKHEAIVKLAAVTVIQAIDHLLSQVQPLKVPRFPVPTVAKPGLHIPRNI
jgi:vacuolar-type H+-ATPase subunit E/Vma4